MICKICLDDLVAKGFRESHVESVMVDGDLDCHHIVSEKVENQTIFVLNLLCKLQNNHFEGFIENYKRTIKNASN